MADEDLYGDLDTSVTGLSSVHLKTQLHEITAKYEALLKEAGNLQHVNAQLGERNQVLERNISLLFATAQTEIGRKDKAIQALRDELQHAQEKAMRQADRSRPSNYDARARDHRPPSASSRPCARDSRDYHR
ncbi:hypothetical protein SPRG_19604 [Saprolegnia parasitica CBS 223.65]|uniref:Uncharacterized protein n=1 Tax=Saprolegnia parasitica (strain CBS 223.65) TaxID=695850 RepID=A0A067CKM9_SAPPC|nr:hypothetical protein SPRG_19604 [Saprolegnia parasitica CBS 223.65]KDO31083.1 hypothetical protein SPRG_19604 [Saprolegnia parasitica CBS 223.65]|eukprot:XP_012198336.1 hypothetical protein SPRG_19604 [Saprolegnia parasitica CBS 223.65]